MLKTYRALSMAAALTEVKRDLGADAVIVNTRTLRSGGVLGLGARNVIEITASAGSPRAGAAPAASRPAMRSAGGMAVAPPPTTNSRPTPRSAATAVEARPQPSIRQPEPSRSRLAPAPATGRAAVIAELRPQLASQSTGGVPRSFVPVVPRALHDALASARAASHTPTSAPANFGAQDNPVAAPARRVAERSPEPARRGIDSDFGSHAQPDSSNAALAVLEGALPEPAALPARRLATPAALAPINESARAAIQEELASIKRLVAQVLQTSRQTAVRVHSASPNSPGPVVGASTEPLMAMSMRLLDAQLAPDLAETLLGAVRDELSPLELADESIVRESVLRHLARAIPIAPDSTLRRSDSGRPLTLALIGPTGVGKTTTVAKLAAALKLRHGKKVGLVTSDTYRIAAVEQLRTYATIIGLPLKVAMTPEDMTAACESLSDCDVILVDTAGRSQHDAERLDELRRHRDAAQPHQTHLVLAAGASESVLIRAADRFKALAPDRLLVTKLDEAVVFGPIVNLASRIGLGLSFVTTGQEVPDHIERARAERLARLVVDGGSVR